MTTQEIIKEIHHYFDNAALFLPNMSSAGGLTVTQLKKEIKIDIVNEYPNDNKEIKVFPVSKIDQAYDVIDNITNFKDRDLSMRLVDEFVRKQNVSFDKSVYLIAYLVGNT